MHSLGSRNIHPGNHLAPKKSTNHISILGHYELGIAYNHLITLTLIYKIIKENPPNTEKLLGDLCLHPFLLK
jgi:hypothetical protein